MDIEITVNKLAKSILNEDNICRMLKISRVQNPRNSTVHEVVGDETERQLFFDIKKRKTNYIRHILQ